MKLFSVLVLSLSASISWSLPRVYGKADDERATLVWLWEKAQKFSGLQALDPIDGISKIPVLLMPEDELTKSVCPEDPQNCHGLAAVYDTTQVRILVREDLNPDGDMVAASFLLHEMVHALQAEKFTEDELFGTCERLFRTEQQAYAAQDAFLKSEGQFFRAGSALRFFICHH